MKNSIEHSHLAQEVTHLENSLANTGHWQDALAMTYSEYGTLPILKPV